MATKLVLLDDEGSNERKPWTDRDPARRDRATLARMVAAGNYATESDVIREGLELLLANDPAFENWLRSEAAAAYDALVADPSLALPIDEVRGRLSALRQLEGGPPSCSA